VNPTADAWLPGHALFSVKELAGLLRVSERCVHHWAATGAIEALRIGGTVRIPRAAVLACLKNSHNSQTAQ